MLSIGKLGAGHHAYYELSVATGREDYYTGKGEARGWYLGAGSKALELNGEVAQGDLAHLFGGSHPRTGMRWSSRRPHDGKARTLRLNDGRVIEGKPSKSTAAFDLTFSAPKSVSVLMGLGDGSVRAAVREGHEAAVRAAFDYLERTACVTRRGTNGTRQLRGEGFVAAAFHHRVSRAADPQLHTHVLVINATKAEGRYTALHGALLYREAKAAGYLYHAALRSELTMRLGLEWYRDPASPHPEIVGVAPELRAVFSKRAEEISEQLAATGNTSARAANAAAIDTRAAKNHSQDGKERVLVRRWRAEAAEIDAPGIEHAIGRQPAKAPILIHTAPIIREVVREQFGPTGLTATKTTFHRRELLQLACEHAPGGATVNQLERLADAFIDRAIDEGRIVQLNSDDAKSPEGDALRGDGTVLRDGRADTPFTTTELLAAELSIIRSAYERASEQVATVERRDLDRVLAGRDERRRLSAEQQRMVEQLTTSGAGMEFVVGLAGAGKTYSLDAAHDAWRAGGVEVRGTSTALAAAQNLQTEAGIRSETIAMLKSWREHAEQTGDRSRIDDAVPRSGVLVVDEAGMTATRDLAFLTELAREQSAKLVLVGDHRQLPEIGAGGAFGHLVHRFDDARTSRLTENRRQHHSWERDALSELREGSVEHAIATYAEQDRIVVDASPERLRQQLAADWLDARSRGRDTAMIAYSNTEVRALNDAARHLLDEHGKLGRDRVRAGGREWAVGDSIICTHNQRSLGLSNGTRGVVERVDRDGLEIRTRDGQLQRVPREYLERGHAEYAYATTGHKTQGLTINGEAFVLASDHVSREWLYVSMSRATDQSRIYIDTLDRDPDTGRALSPAEQRDIAILELHDIATRSAAHRLAHERGEPRDSQRLDRNDLRQALNRDAVLRERLERGHGHQPRRRKRDVGRVREIGGRDFGFGR
ncbi:MAG: relaxase domain-containing protein [Thermoleophilia bacterium]|nr:relaxase domain-containing protein [Thermoleophilia bacterium]